VHGGAGVNGEVRALRVYFHHRPPSTVMGFVDVVNGVVCYEYVISEDRKGLGYIPLSSIIEVKEV